jgi:hypothetical protein
MVQKDPDSTLSAWPGVAASDYAVTVSVRPSAPGDGSAGLMFGRSNSPRQFYTFEIYQDGWYEIWRYNGNAVTAWTTLDTGSSPSINQGVATNLLKVVRNGASISTYANGQLVASVVDNTFLGERLLGLTVTSYNEIPYDVRFDNYRVYPLPCGATTITGMGSRPTVASESPGRPGVQSGHSGKARSH